MGDTVLSLIRTYVPIIVGSFVSWLVTLGVELDAVAEQGLIVGLTGVLIGAYYTIARVLEKKWPVFGLLLGSRKQPEYVEPPTTP